MKISGVDIRPGNIIEYEGGIWRAVKIQHTQPGKGGAYMQVEMKNLIDGRKTNVRFRSAETVERVRLDTKDFQFLFADDEDLTFMDRDNYEQITLPRDTLSVGPDGHPYMRYWNIKSKREAVLPVPPQLAEQLERHEAALVDEYPEGTDWLLPSPPIAWLCRITLFVTVSRVRPSPKTDPSRLLSIPPPDAVPT